MDVESVYVVYRNTASISYCLFYIIHVCEMNEQMNSGIPNKYFSSASEGSFLNPVLPISKNYFNFIWYTYDSQA